MSENKPIKHLIIPDVQAQPNVDLSHLSWIGQYIIEKQPDVIVCLGDFADMESLCSYDKGKKSFEGRRYKKDIASAQEAMEMLLEPMQTYNEQQKRNKQKQYKPRMIMCLGNHEERIKRVSEWQPELEGVVSYDDLPYQDWEVVDFLDTIVVDGVLYTHYLSNPMSGRPYGGTALSQLTKVGHSYVVGHKQTLDVATRFTVAGVQQWGIIAGACYLHNEGYKGYQGNHHWRGIIMAHRVNGGSMDPMFISLDYLKNRYKS